MACFLAFFTLFHLSLTFVRPEVPFKDLKYLVKLILKLSFPRSFQKLVSHFNLTFLILYCFNFPAIKLSC